MKTCWFIDHSTIFILVVNIEGYHLCRDCTLWLLKKKNIVFFREIRWWLLLLVNEDISGLDPFFCLRTTGAAWNEAETICIKTQCTILLYNMGICHMIGVLEKEYTSYTPTSNDCRLSTYRCEKGYYLTSLIDCIISSLKCNLGGSRGLKMALVRFMMT